MKEKVVCWLSGGVSSFIAGYLRRDIIDELDPNRGRNKIIVPECGINCQIISQEDTQ